MAGRIESNRWPITGEVSGVFQLVEGSGLHGRSDTNGQNGVTFDASQSNSIYSGTTVQVASLQTLICIKF